MRNLLLQLGFVILFSSCINKVEKIKIDRFVWIQHNQNLIWDSTDLQAKFYIEFLDSCNMVKMSKTNVSLKHSDYFIANAPDSLRYLIFKNLYSKKFPDCFDDDDRIPNFIHYDGDFYCIIYKFSNGTEQILNFAYSIPDSLSNFSNYLQNLTQLNSYIKTDSFDRTSIIDKYRNKIISCGPLALPPPPSDREQ